ncbi:MAG: glycosyltransferase family 87 protein [Chloroflexota bacterium]
MIASDPLVRGARLISTALIVGVGISIVIFTIQMWSVDDVGAYLGAAHRLLNGQPLYPATGDIDGGEVYRYSPWFAVAWIPFTLLPAPMVTVVWEIVLAAAAMYVAWRLIRLNAHLLLALVGPIMLDSVSDGNVHVLLLAGLLRTAAGRWGPLCIAAAASLKAVPLLLILVYVGRGEWRRVAATLAITALLVAPMLAFDLTNYTTSPGSFSLLYGTVAYVPIAIAAAAVTVLLGRSRFGWLAAATAMVVTIPRFLLYDLTFLSLGVVGVDQQDVPRQ